MLERWWKSPWPTPRSSSRSTAIPRRESVSATSRSGRYGSGGTPPSRSSGPDPDTSTTAASGRGPAHGSVSVPPSAGPESTATVTARATYGAPAGASYHPAGTAWRLGGWAHAGFAASSITPTTTAASHVTNRIGPPVPHGLRDHAHRPLPNERCPAILPRIQLTSGRSKAVRPVAPHDTACRCRT
jgi:hypothetical protein